ncbi:MAG: DUF4129 domain-containing protein [Bacteroidetes bacterium]|nr:DUF4129 domain-containing protein [Bacteroidota bacterium]
MKLFFSAAFVVCLELAHAQTDSTTFAVDTLKKEQHYEAVDTTPVTQRKFSEQAIQKLKTDPDLKYKQPPTVAENLWERFKSWLAELVRNFFSNVTTTHLGKILLYVAGAALLVYVVSMILKVNAFRILVKGGDGTIPHQMLSENIHEMNFEKLIAEATQKKEYRLATRLVFLYALKILSDRHLIDWEPGKTNHDYVRELQHPELRNGFLDLSFYFDYAWYGNFRVTPETFSEMLQVFNSWKAKTKE